MQRVHEDERIRKKMFDEAIDAISVYIKDQKKTDYGIKKPVDSEDMFLESAFLRGVRQGWCEGLYQAVACIQALKEKEIIYV